MGWSQIVDTYFHTDDNTKHKAVAKIDNQFIDSTETISKEQNIETPTDNTPIVKGNVIFFDFEKAVNQ